MNQQPDKFFREKLYNYEQRVPDQAWDHIAHNLQRKNKWGMFVKVAAAVAILATGTLLIIPARRGDNGQLSDQNMPPVPRDLPAVHEKPAEESTPPASALADADESVVKARPQQQQRKIVQRPKSNESGISKEDHPGKTNSPDEEKVPQLASEEMIAEHTVVQVADLPSEEESGPQVKKNVTIVFSADEVNRKYLTKNTATDATDEQESSSGLKKLLNKAYDLKNSQDLIGSLRQRKNDILAMNFRNEKQTQND